MNSLVSGAWIIIGEWGICFAFSNQRLLIVFGVDNSLFYIFVLSLIEILHIKYYVENVRKLECTSLIILDMVNFAMYFLLYFEYMHPINLLASLPIHVSTYENPRGTVKYEYAVFVIWRNLKYNWLNLYLNPKNK